ncbi:MAG TPA: hypothetical protein VGO93_02195, partial [Candidatus Xenobia bacterium]
MTEGAPVLFRRSAFPAPLAAGLASMFLATLGKANTGAALACGAALTVVAATWWMSRQWWPALASSMATWEEGIKEKTRANPGPWIVLASAVALFAELMIIRWHANDCAVFGFLKNVSMLSCFLGLGMGFSRGRRFSLQLPLFIPALALQLFLLHLLSFTTLQEQLGNPIPEEATLGLRSASSITDYLLVFGFVLTVFVINAWTFVPLGQLVTWLMDP